MAEDPDLSPEGTHGESKCLADGSAARRGEADRANGVASIEGGRPWGIGGKDNTVRMSSKTPESIENRSDSTNRWRVVESKKQGTHEGSAPVEYCAHVANKLVEREGLLNEIVCFGEIFELGGKPSDDDDSDLGCQLAQGLQRFQTRHARHGMIE